MVLLKDFNKIDKPLARLTNQREKTQITNMEMKYGTELQFEQKLEI